MWGTLSSLLPEVLSGLTTNPWYFRALEIHLYKTWTKKGKKPGGHELPLVRQMTCSFINETITLERGSKHIPSSLYNPQFSQAKPFNWAMTMEYLIVALKFWRRTSSASVCISGLLSKYNIADLKLVESDSSYIGGSSAGRKGVFLNLLAALTTNTSGLSLPLPFAWTCPDGLLPQDEITNLICGWLGKTRVLFTIPLASGM